MEGWEVERGSSARKGFCGNKNATARDNYQGILLKSLSGYRTNHCICVSHARAFSLLVCMMALNGCRWLMAVMDNVPCSCNFFMFCSTHHYTSINILYIGPNCLMLVHGALKALTKTYFMCVFACVCMC